MRKYSFLASGQWIAWFLMCCVAAVVCVYLAQWQMSRNDHLVAENQKITQNYDAAPLTPAEGLPLFEHYDDAVTWHPVALRGTYLPEDTVLVRNRPQNGQVGYEVLVPFRADDGTTVVIDRGWIPTGNATNGMPDAVPAPPTGHVAVVARLHPGEPAIARDAPRGQIASIDLDELRERCDLPLATGGYGQLASEDPAPDGAPVRAGKPEIGYGPHLSYSFQWYAFSLLVFVAYGYAARQHVRNEEWDRAYAAEVERRLARFYDEHGNYTGELDEELIIRELQMADDMPAHLKSLYRPKRASRRAVVTDEDEEDALLDALEAGRQR